MAHPSDSELRSALSFYSTSLSTRAFKSKSSSDLVELDAWFRSSLRQPTPTPLTVAQLGRLMEWKLARGKWRPKLVALALSNPATLVLSSTTAASTLPSAAALKALCALKGVGPATASAILSLYHPATEPFMSDEAYEAVGLGKAEYTVKGWEKFRAAMEKRREEGAWDGMEELEMACWSWGVRKKYVGGVEEQPGEGGVATGAGEKPAKVAKVSKKRGSEAGLVADAGREEQEADVKSGRATRVSKRTKSS